MQPPGGEPGILVNMDKLVAEPGYHNPSPLVWLIGCASEAMVLEEGLEMTALVDARSQVSTLTEVFCSEFGLRSLPWGACCILRDQGYCNTVQGINRG